jgi:pyruvate dehydrogenase E2 component (dihydrolipoamide acetyltransferase)
MPKTGMAMEEGSIVEWKVKEGDRVGKGDIVAIIETDKSTMELESDYDGVILAILYEAGDTVPVTKTIAWIGKEGEAVPAEANKTAEYAELSRGNTEETKTSAVPGTKILATPAARSLAKEKGVALDAVPPSGKSGEVRRADVEKFSGASVSATPLAKKIAANEGINLSGIQGTGARGKIVSADVISSADAAAAQPRAGMVFAAPEDRRVPLTNIQKITGKRMLESRQTIPEVTENTRADVTKMLALRAELNAQYAAAKIDAKVTVNDFVLAAVVKSLVKFPRMNAVFAGAELIYKGSVNLGFAAATERGLLVPVIRNAQFCNLRELSAEAQRLAAKAREGKLSPDELSGGTFTVSNVGMYGITSFTPIINPPEAGILGVCAVEDELAFDGDKIIQKKKMNLSLAFDHRINDGAESALFLKNVKELLEAPLLLI